MKTIINIKHDAMKKKKIQFESDDDEIETEDTQQEQNAKDLPPSFPG